MNKLSVSEAVAKIEAGEPLAGYTIDFDQIKVEALTVMKLVKHGIPVPEAAIYYDDAATQDDDDFAGDWQRIDYDPIEEAASTVEIRVPLGQELKSWIESKDIALDELVKALLENCYATQQLITKD
jgi:hypothetical protein